MSIDKIRKVLVPDLTPGPWFSVNDGTKSEPFMSVKAERISGRGPTHEVAVCATGDSPQGMETANARFIAACNPEAIRELLDELDALKADAERYLWLRDQCPSADKAPDVWHTLCKKPRVIDDLLNRVVDLDAAIDAARGIT